MDSNKHVYKCHGFGLAWFHIVQKHLKSTNEITQRSFRVPGTATLWCPASRASRLLSRSKWIPIHELFRKFLCRKGRR